MNDDQDRIPEDIAPEVLALASRYYAQQQQSYSESELVAAGSEVNIPPELIQQAIRDVQAQRQRAQVKHQERQRQRQFFVSLTAAVGAIVLLWGVITYNALTTAESNVDAAWAQVENQLQRRADLIPKLVSVTQAYAEQEQEIARSLAQSRESYLAAETLREKTEAFREIEAAIEQLYNYAAANPQLQSSQLFTNLQYEIAGTENRIAVERRRYNQAVQTYNRSLKQFPHTLVAQPLGFESKDFFEATDTESPDS